MNSAPWAIAVHTYQHYNWYACSTKLAIFIFLPSAVRASNLKRRLHYRVLRFRQALPGHGLWWMSDPWLTGETLLPGKWAGWRSWSGWHRRNSSCLQVNGDLPSQLPQTKNPVVFLNNLQVLTPSQSPYNKRPLAEVLKCSFRPRAWACENEPFMPTCFFRYTSCNDKSEEWKTCCAIILLTPRGLFLS